MAFTREMIRNAAKESGVEIPKELEDRLVNEHLTARDAHARAQVEAALAENPPAETVKVKDSDEYKKLKKDFEDYKARQDAKEARQAKESAYRELLRKCGVSEKRLDAVLKVSDIDSVELAEDGSIKTAAELEKTIKEEWADFITTRTVRGANTATPPANTGGGSSKTKEEIMNMKDAGARQKAILENPQLFGIE